jgi:hypothetical protein
MYRRIIVYTRIIITVSIRHSHGAVRCASVYSRQRRLRVTWCIIRLVFFFVSFFSFSRTQYTNLYYIIILCIHTSILCALYYTLSLQFYISLVLLPLRAQSIILHRYLSLVICPGQHAVCVCVCLYIIRAYGRKPGCDGETKQTPRGFQREGKKRESVILLLQRVVVGFGRSVCRRNDQKFTYICMHVYYVTRYHDNCHILLYHTIFKVDSYYRFYVPIRSHICV